MSIFKRHEDKDESLNAINITPLTDCMMVLLIIFMITGSALSQSGFNINLPESGYSEDLSSSQISISIDKDGNYFLNDKKADEASIKSFFQNGVKKSDSIMIYGDRNVEYQKIMKIMDLARSAGITGIGLAVRD